MNKTYKDILKRLQNGLPDGASAIEGTFSGNNLLAVANELARIYDQHIIPLLPRAFAQTAFGEDLARVGEDIGVYRKDATCAEAIVSISGAPGKYSDILVAADNILFLVDDFTIGSGGTVDARAVCQISGMAGNVPAGAIKEIKTAGVLLMSVINKDDAHGGYEKEAEDAYRKRILEKKRNIITGGNRENYRQWALSVAGVSKVKVIDLFAGPGTVGVYIIANDNAVPDTKLIEDVSSYIESVRTCGAEVSVMPAEPLQIDISAVLILTDGRNIENIKKVFTGLLSAYIESFPFIYRKKLIFSYIKVADLLLQIDGIEDVTGILINGSTSSITLDEIQFPVIGEITLQVAE